MVGIFLLVNLYPMLFLHVIFCNQVKKIYRKKRSFFLNH